MLIVLKNDVTSILIRPHLEALAMSVPVRQVLLALVVRKNHL